MLYQSKQPPITSGRWLTTC